MRLASGVLTIVLVSGCAHRIDSVEQRMLLPASAARYDMAAHQAFVYPAPMDNAAPSFPLGEMPRELAPVTLCVGFVVDGEGRATEVSPLLQPGCADPQSQPALRDAALAAVSTWRFQPALFCDYSDAATRDRDWNGHGCAGAVVQSRVVPVSLAYAFTFEIREGRQRIAAAKR